MKITSLEDDPQYQLFIKHHYSIIVKQSLRPIWHRDQMIFPIKKIIIKRKLSLIEKLYYYFLDLKLYFKHRDNNNEKATRSIYRWK